MNILGIFLGALLLTPASVQEWHTDYAASQIHLIVKRGDGPQAVPVQRFQVQAHFDRARPADGRLVLEMDFSNPESPQRGLTTLLTEPNQPESPTQVRFSTHRLTKDPYGSLLAEGELSIRGQTRPVAIPLQLHRKRDRWNLSGVLPFRHADFGMNTPEDAPPQQAEIRFQLLLRP